MGHFIDAAFHNNTELINSINKDPCKLLIAAKKLRYERLYNDYFIFVLVHILSRDTPRSRTWIWWRLLQEFSRSLNFELEASMLNTIKMTMLQRRQFADGYGYELSYSSSERCSDAATIASKCHAAGIRHDNGPFLAAFVAATYDVASFMVAMITDMASRTICWRTKYSSIKKLVVVKAYARTISCFSRLSLDTISWICRDDCFARHSPVLMLARRMSSGPSLVKSQQ